MRSDDRQYETIATAGAPFHLEKGGRLGPVTVAYETYGQLDADHANAILITHALTGDSHVARHRPGDGAGWWDDLVGPGKALDTQRYFVICSNVLGGCQGTTGPASPDPTGHSGERYGRTFPAVTVKDMVRVQRRLLDRLEIERLQAVIGGSLGGMQALEWAVSQPDQVRLAVPIAAPAVTSAQSIAFNEVQRQAILLHPDRPRQGMAVARMMAMITYQSYEGMEQKFGRRRTELQDADPFSAQYEVESYLRYKGQNLTERFDPDSYLYLSRAMDDFDIGAGRGGMEEALSRITARLAVIGISSDILYPLEEQQQLVNRSRDCGVTADLFVLHSSWGHDAFLIDTQEVGRYLRQQLESVGSGGQE